MKIVKSFILPIVGVIITTLLLLSAPVEAASDTTPPSNGSIKINNDDTETSSISVTLTISATDDVGVTNMMISNNSSFKKDDGVTDSTWIGYATSSAWQLTRGDGDKTVYIKFKDAAGNESPAYSDTITLTEQFAQTGDTFVTCDIDGLETGKFFSSAAVTISGVTPGDGWAYYGVDIGIFKKPDNYDPDNPSAAQWEAMPETDPSNPEFQKRIVTTSTLIDITNFGDITKYDFSKVYAVGYRVLYQALDEDIDTIVEGPWKIAPIDPGGYFKPYQQLQGIAFNPDGGIFAGEVTVEISCSDSKGVKSTRYAWSNSNDPTAIPAGDWTTSADPAYAVTRKIGEGTWYLHVEMTNNDDVKKLANRKYEIIPKVSVSVRPDDGTMMLAGKNGQIKLLSGDGLIQGQEVWSAGAKNIYSTLAFSNGSTLFAGQDGNYAIRNSSGGWAVSSGTWTQGNQTSVKTLAPVYKRDGSGKFADEILMVGSQGKWQVINSSGSMPASLKGDTDLGEEMAAAGRQDGIIVMAGSDGKVKILKPNTAADGYILYKQEKWMLTGGDKEYQAANADSKHIYAVLTLPDKSLLFAGEEGKIQRRTYPGYWKDPMIWGPWDDGQKRDIITMTLLPNGDVLMVGRDGYFQVLKIADDYTLSLGTGSEDKGKYLPDVLTQVQSASPREDGRVAIVGSNWNVKLFKLDVVSNTELKSIGSTKVEVEATWEGKALRGGEIIWKETADTEWNSTPITNTTTTVTGLTLGTYDIKARALMLYPIYYMSDNIDAETIMPVEISKFTDRVTGANNWMNDTQAAQLNKYYPDSEVVCKVDIDPTGEAADPADIDGYEITMDANADNTANMAIEGLKVVRIDIGSTVIGDGRTAIYASNADKNPLTTDTVEFDITNATLNQLETRFGKTYPDKPGTELVTVYFKYNIKNGDTIPDSFKNKIKIKAISGGSSKDIEEENTIYMRKTKAQYM